MKNATNSDDLPTLVSDVLSCSHHCIDNIFADSWKSLRLNSLLKKAGFRKRSGTGIAETVYLALLWNWLNMSSIAMFCRQAIGTFSTAKKDVIYDLLKREDVNWRGLNTQIAKTVFDQADGAVAASVHSFWMIPLRPAEARR